MPNKFQIRPIVYHSTTIKSHTIRVYIDTQSSLLQTHCDKTDRSSGHPSSNFGYRDSDNKTV